MNLRLRFLTNGLVSALACAVVSAQVPPPQQQPQQQAPFLSPQQLDDLVAPIALYPDPLLGQVMAASTYPLEVVVAQQWLRQNDGLKGNQLMDAARQQDWDPSVQALVAFPNVLTLLNQDVRWTTDLGNAFLAQQSDVMAAVQRMRSSARARGRLSSSTEQVVTSDIQNGQQAIEIQPADPQVMYVPTYDPAYIWGPPTWGYYPSLYYPTFGFGFWPGYDVGFSFGGWGGWGGWRSWGWGPNWFGGGIFVNHAFFRNFGFRAGFGGGFAGRGLWSHDPNHRLGISYPNGQLSARYGAASRAGAARTGSRFGGGQSFGTNRAGLQGMQNGARQFGGSRSTAQGGQNWRSAGSQAGSRAYQGPQAGPRGYQGSQMGSGGYQGSQSFRGTGPQGGSRSYQSAPRQSFQSTPRYSAPAQRFSGGGGGGAPRSFNGGGGGAARSFSGGGGHSSSNGGGGHSGRR